MQRHTNPRPDDHLAGQFGGYEVVERLVDARDIDDDPGNLRHDTSESRCAVGAT
jgi:hypothetical protein